MAQTPLQIAGMAPTELSEQVLLELAAIRALVKQCQGEVLEAIRTECSRLRNSLDGKQIPPQCFSQAVAESVPSDVAMREEDLARIALEASRKRSAGLPSTGMLTERANNALKALSEVAIYHPTDPIGDKVSCEPKPVRVEPENVVMLTAPLLDNVGNTTYSKKAHMAPVVPLAHAAPLSNTPSTASLDCHGNPFFTARWAAPLEDSHRVNLGPPASGVLFRASAPVSASSTPTGVVTHSPQPKVGYFEDFTPKFWDDAEIKGWIRVTMRMTARIPDKRERCAFLWRQYEQLKLHVVPEQQADMEELVHWLVGLVEHSET